MKTLARPFFWLLAVSSFAVHAPAQSFYFDCSEDSGPSSAPEPTYGGPRGIPGAWNALPLASGSVPLVDVDGNASGVSAFVTPGCDTGGCTPEDIGGGDGNLLEDWWNGDCYASPNNVSFIGLAAGTYQIVVIGYGACDPGITTAVRVRVGGVEQAFLSSGGVHFPGDWVDFPLGVASFAIAPGQALQLTQWGSNFGGGLVGIQLVRLGEAPTPYCFGDLGGCPCEPGAAGHGCPSSFDANGALLAGSGAAELDADSLSLTATGVGNGFVTFLQGSTVLGGGAGVVFGDGLRCTGGQVVRLKTKLASGGTAIYPAAGEPAISVKGMVPAAGGFRGYQVWYRNPTAFCTEGTFNFTNAVAVDWH